MSDHAADSPVTLMHARTPAEAAVVAALLRSADIPFYVGGRLLVDEFAISQGMLGLKSEISVRSRDLLAAQALLAEARASGREFDSGGGAGSEAGGTRDDGGC